MTEQSYDRFSAPGSASLRYLGKHFIEGLETVGAQEAVVIKSGAIGNDSPIEVQREYWYSPQLGVNLMRKLHDPRIGIQNFEVSEISLGEPEEKLFKIVRPRQGLPSDGFFGRAPQSSVRLRSAHQGAPRKKH